MRKHALLAPAAVVASLLAFSSDRGPLQARQALAAVDPQKDKNYDLASLDVFRKTIVQIKDNYVDPSRINPKEMFTSALEAVERQVAEVMVEVGGPPCDDRPANREPGTSLSGPSNAAPQAECWRRIARSWPDAATPIPASPRTASG